MTSPSPICEAVACLRRGGIVCFRTESYYGLAVDALSESSVDRLLELKGARGSAPIGVIAGDIDQVFAVSKGLVGLSRELADLHWPGALSLVLPARGEVPRAISNERGGIAVRVSARQGARELALEFGSPITATSANPSGRPPATTVSSAREYFGAGVDMYLDDGVSPGGAPSTVAEVVGGDVKIHRQGAVHLLSPC